MKEKISHWLAVCSSFQLYWAVTALKTLRRPRAREPLAGPWAALLGRLSCTRSLATAFLLLLGQRALMAQET